MTDIARLPRSTLWTSLPAITTLDLPPEVPACWAWPPPSRFRLIRSETVRRGYGPRPWLDGSDLRHLIKAYEHHADWFYAFHGGRCAICGVRDKRLEVDHDHWSGLVRGLLCGPCNVRQGRLPSGITPPFSSYVWRPPAAQLSHREVYADGHSRALIRIWHEVVCREEYRAAIEFLSDKLVAEGDLPGEVPDLAVRLLGLIKSPDPTPATVRSLLHLTSREAQDSDNGRVRALGRSASDLIF